MPVKIEALQSDITQIKADAIVNAAKIAVSSVKKYFKENPQSQIKKVIFATLDELDYNIYTQILEQGSIDINKI